MNKYIKIKSFVIANIFVALAIGIIIYLGEKQLHPPNHNQNYWITDEFITYLEMPEILITTKLLGSGIGNQIGTTCINNT
jgi:hypothetical protein